MDQWLGTAYFLKADVESSVFSFFRNFYSRLTLNDLVDFFLKSWRQGLHSDVSYDVFYLNPTIFDHYMKFLISGDRDWPSHYFDWNADVKRFILMFNLATSYQVRNLTFFISFDLTWPRLTLKMLFLKKLCQELHFDVKLAFFSKKPPSQKIN